MEERVLGNLLLRSLKISYRESHSCLLADHSNFMFDRSNLLFVRQYLDRHKLVVVCSARSGSTKPLGTTNLLIQAAKQAVPSSSTSRSRANSQPDTPGTSTPLSSFWAANNNSNNNGGSDRDRSISKSPVRLGRKGSYYNSESPTATRSLSQSLMFTNLNGSNNTNGINGNGTSSGKPDYEETVDLIKSEHLIAARSSVSSAEILETIEAEIERDCESLKMFLGAAQVLSSFIA